MSVVIQAREKGRQQSWSYGGYFLVDDHDHDVRRRFPPLFPFLIWKGEVKETGWR